MTHASSACALRNLLGAIRTDHRGNVGASAAIANKITAGVKQRPAT
jgi:hypothetical protein